MLSFSFCRIFLLKEQNQNHNWKSSFKGRASCVVSVPATGPPMREEDPTLALADGMTQRNYKVYVLERRLHSFRCPSRLRFKGRAFDIKNQVPSLLCSQSRVQSRAEVEDGCSKSHRTLSCRILKLLGHLVSICRCAD